MERGNNRSTSCIIGKVNRVELLPDTGHFSYCPPRCGFIIYLVSRIELLSTIFPTSGSIRLVFRYAAAITTWIRIAMGEKYEPIDRLIEHRSS